MLHFAHDDPVSPMRRPIRSLYREDPPEQEGPSILAILIIVNIGVFLLQKLFAIAPPGDGPMAPAGYISMQTLRDGEFWTVFTHLFVHADLVHLAANMLVLFLFGRRVLEESGAKQFGYLYFLGGLTGTALQLIAGKDGDRAVLIGASGAVCAVMAAFAVRLPHFPVLGFLRPWLRLRLSARSLVLGMALASLILDVANRFTPLDNMAHLCHLGGFIFGWLHTAHRYFQEERLLSARRMRLSECAREFRSDQDSPFAPVAKSKQFWSEEDAMDDFALPTHSEPVSNQAFLLEQVDPILEKLHATGMNSLTEQERGILREAAKRLKDKGSA